MEKGRLIAFSDGVIAIIITIMVLELKVPHGDDLAALRPLISSFLSYILSFINLGIYGCVAKTGAAGARVGDFCCLL